jgi:hypothetical protein
VLQKGGKRAPYKEARFCFDAQQLIRMQTRVDITIRVETVQVVVSCPPLASSFKHAQNSREGRISALQDATRSTIPSTYTSATAAPASVGSHAPSHCFQRAPCSPSCLHALEQGADGRLGIYCTKILLSSPNVRVGYRRCDERKLRGQLVQFAIRLCKSHKSRCSPLSLFPSFLQLPSSTTSSQLPHHSHTTTTPHHITLLDHVQLLRFARRPPCCSRRRQFCSSCFFSELYRRRCKLSLSCSLSPQPEEKL